MYETDHTPRFETLRDYVPPLRRQRWLIALIAFMAVAVSVAYSGLKTPTYQATASLNIQDQTVDLGLIGAAAVPSQTTAQLAQIAAQYITSPQVLEAVRRDLRTNLTLATLKRDVTSGVEPTSNLVDVQAASSKAAFAAALANSAAREAESQTNAAARTRYARAAATLRRRVTREKNPTAKALDHETLSRLETLSALAQPATIAALAQVPGSPASPKPALDTLIALIVGLIIGIVVALIRESLDRRLRTAADIQRHVALPLLGHVSEGALGGAGGYRDAAGGGEHEAAEAFRIVRQNLRFLHADSPVGCVLVTSALPAEGKTTVAIGLALASAAAAKRTLLVECDLRRPDVAERLGLRKAPGLSDYMSGSVSSKDILQTVDLPMGDVLATAGANGATPSVVSAVQLVCITAGTTASHPAELLGSDRFATFLEEVAHAYDFVMLDTSPVLPVVDTLELLPQVDGVVLCVRNGQTTRDQAAAARTVIGHFPPRPIGLVVTGTRHQDREYGYEAYGYEAYGYEGYGYSYASTPGTLVADHKSVDS